MRELCEKMLISDKLICFCAQSLSISFLQINVLTMNLNAITKLLFVFFLKHKREIKGNFIRINHVVDFVELELTNYNHYNSWPLLHEIGLL